MVNILIKIGLVLVLASSTLVLAQSGKKQEKQNQKGPATPEQLLEKHLSGKITDEDTLLIFDKSIGCGVLLWDYLKTANKLPMPSGAKPINLITTRNISYKGVNKSNKLQAGIFSERSEILEINKHLNNFAAGKTPKIRKPTDEEMFYLQKTIFSEGLIEYVLTADLGTDKLIYNFQTQDGQKRITWVDIIGDVLGN